jgi:hypothetical protein
MHVMTTKCYNIYLIIKNVLKKIILDFIVPLLQAILKIHNKIVNNLQNKTQLSPRCSYFPIKMLNNYVLI